MRIVFGGIYSIAVIAAVTVFFCRPEMLKGPVPDAVAGFNAGFFAGLEAVMVYYLIKYIAALRSDEKLNALYVYENDERIRYIRAKIGGTGMTIVIAGLAAGVVIAGFFDFTVFVTLLCALLFTLLTKLGLKGYYSKKY
jgi:hypothetical protein